MLIPISERKKIPPPMADPFARTLFPATIPAIPKKQAIALEINNMPVSLETNPRCFIR
jgi:hypothetical protein